MALAEMVYRTSRGFPADERFGLTAQLRRAAVSIPSNIAEGQGRSTTGEFQQFLGHARGSINELQTQMELAYQLGYAETDGYRCIRDKSTEVANLLNALIVAIRDKPRTRNTKHETRNR